MLDYVNWYLVELERRLRGKRTAQASTDLLLETRAHLEERVSDLTAKGIDPVTAARAAITDFGDPASVVYAYTHPVDTPRKAPVWALALVAMGTCLGIPMLTSVSGILGVASANSAPGVVTLLLGTALFVAGLSWWTRRIVMWPAVVSLFVAAIGYTTWLANATVEIKTGDRTVYAMESRLGFEKQIRDRWLAAYGSDMANLAAWQAHPSVDTLNALIGPDRYAPSAQSFRGSAIAFALPSTASDYQFFTTVSPGRLRARRVVLPGFELRPMYSQESALEMWRENGAEYTKWIQEAHEIVAQDRKLLDSATSGDFGARWRSLSLAPLAYAMVVGLAGLAVNGAVLVLFGASDHLRRRSWRRQVI